MSNKFEIAIVGVDKFTAVFNKLRKQAASTIKPMSDAGKASKDIFNAPGIAQAGRTFETIAEHARSISSSLGGAVGLALRGAAGTGAVGMGVAALATALAAVAALTAKWAELGFQVNRTSIAIGTSTDVLQRWQGIAKLGGLDPAAADSALTGLAQTLHAAKWGDVKAQSMVAKMQQMGVVFKADKNGAYDLNDALMQLSDILVKIPNAQTRQRMAAGLGIEPLLPLLLQGSQAVQRLGDEADRLGMVQGKKALDWAVAFTNALNNLKGATEGVFNSLGKLFSPPMISAMEEMTRMLSGGVGKSPSVQGVEAPKPPKSWWDELMRGPATVGDAETGWLSMPKGRTTTLAAPSAQAAVPVDLRLHITGLPTGVSAAASANGQRVPVRISGSMGSQP